MLNNGILRILSFLVCSFCIALGYSVQGQGIYESVKILKDATVTKRVDPCYFPTVIDSALHGTLTFTKIGSSKYDILYTPDNGFLGNDTVVVEYKTASDVSGLIKYKSYVYTMANSYLEPVNDFISIYKDQTNQTINPLLNDYTSVTGPNPIHLSGECALVNSLINVSKLNDSIIQFSAKPGYDGPASIQYKVCDSFGLCQTASIKVYIVDTTNIANSDTINIGTPEDVSVQITLPYSGFTISNTADHGYVEIEAASVVYKPFSNYNGKDTFLLSFNGMTRLVCMSVYAQAEPNSIIVPDVFFTPVNKEITFNVSLNDVQSIVEKYNILLDLGPNKGTLVKLDNHGLFKYTPENNYSGEQSFTYKVCPQGICEKAKVTLFIGDQQPRDLDYKFATPKNTPLVLSYAVPVDVYDFSASSDSVKFYPGWDTVHVKYNNSCTQDVIGFNQLIFYPKYNTTYLDTFEVNYCIAGSNRCFTLKCEVDVFYETKNCDKQCVGDCVWPGDVDYDGIVNMKDMLHVAYQIGKTGPSRTYQNSDFRSHKANNWSEQLTGRSVNLKNADTNGDSTISSADTLAISENYHQTHSLVPQGVYSRGDFPFNLEVLTPEAESGDVALIEVQLGDDQYPVINLSGYTYNLDYNTDAVVEGTLGIDFYERGWFANNAATLNMYKIPWVGRLESGFARANALKASGQGGTEVIVFVIEDNIDPFRDDDGIYEVPFYFKNIVIQNGAGEMQQLEDKTAIIKLKRAHKNQKPVLDASKLLVYPNPTSDMINLHLNGKNSMLSYSILSMDGRLIQSNKNIDPKHNMISLEGLNNGLYLIKAETLLGPITKKIEIMK